MTGWPPNSPVLGYTRLGKADKGLLRQYLAKVTGLSRAQLTRLIGQFVEHGAIQDRRGRPAKPFARRYTAQDLRLLAEIDALHGTLSGPATRKLCERAYHRFGDTRYQRLAGISNGHLYNLRQAPGYNDQRGQFTKTRATTVQIGQRRKPRPDGQPGFLRVDSLHQGDLDGFKGLHHINLIDEVTQHQLSPYLNFHRPRFFPTEQIDARGRLRKHYRYSDMMTPYEKLKSLPDAERFLKPGATFQQLDAIAYAISDNEAARRLNQARGELFETINRTQIPAA